MNVVGPPRSIAGHSVVRGGNSQPAPRAFPGLRGGGVFLLAALVAALSLSHAGPAAAQLEKHDIDCINTFNKGLRKISKTHGKLVKKCTTRFASGSLVGQTPEQCIASDSGGKLLRTMTKEGNKIGSRCSGGLPGFGVSDIQTALTRAILTQFGLVHGTIGPDLDDNLIADSDDASCQAKVTAALLKCEDTRQKEYLKCQKKGLKKGEITDGTALADDCLGAGLALQPDEKGRIASKCGAKLLTAVVKHCDETDLSQAFASCGSTDPAVTAACLSSESACQLCRMLNDAGGVVRDCDAFDDGDDTNGSCNAECGDGLVHPEESCDDGNGASGDGCSDFCLEEFGYTCTGEPSVCTPNCGNGAIDIGEACDDGDTASGDGCSDLCTVENGYTCTGEPSACEPSCGNGNIQPGEGEVCDDDNGVGGDGCSATCQVEPGYVCTGNPSVCTFVCGNGAFDPGETCDDGNATGGDGCSALCQIESGFLCSGLPSLCAPICGDGLLRSIEGCDDGNLTSGDGCSSLCQIETGFGCGGTPSSCSAICGDGFIRGNETCDDANTISGDGCSGNFCRTEFDSFCSGQPSVCIELCGNGVLDGIEECDDGNAANGDGCQGNCTTQAGYACFGEPSACFPTCGNSVIDAGETCDDGNSVGADGCSPSCKTEPGWLCPVPGTLCNKFDVFIDTPLHGVFTTSSTQVITGHYTVLPAGEVQVLVNGVPASSLNQVARTFSHTVSLSGPNVFNPVLVRLVHTPTAQESRDRIVVIRGASVADGAYSPQSVALRINDRGLDSIEPLVGELAAGEFDIGELLPPGSVVTSGCFIDAGVLGCWGSATVRIASPAPSFGSLGLALDSQTNSVFGDIDISNIVINVNIEGSGLVPNCSLRMSASNLQLTGNYSLEPLAGSPSNIDVNLITPLGVAFSGFTTTFTSGLCNEPIIGDIIQSLLPDVEALAVDGIRGFLEDPDGAGPEDSPIADGIEEVLAGISVSGPVGEGVGLQLDSPLFAVTEDNAGITLGSNARFLVSIGNGPGQCQPPPGAPDLAASYSPASSFPNFGANSPDLNQPYGLGISISSAGFNQLLRGQTNAA
jgi:cysteine-rich repeat protein